MYQGKMSAIRYNSTNKRQKATTYTNGKLLEVLNSHKILNTYEDVRERAQRNRRIMGGHHGEPSN